VVFFLVHYLVMNRINISEAKAYLSKYVRRIRKGESFVLCDRNTPVAEIRPLPPETAARRRIGLLRGSFSVPPEFFDPLPDEMIAALEGESGGSRATRDGR